MSNPTSNFGWQMPTATDLVTDLPADFEVFGQAVDTDFVDLLGGTTGQVLSKTSATDLDFTWINNDTGDITGVTAGTGISGGGTSGTVTVTNDMATTITAAGDIVVGTGSGTYDNLPIGTTAQVLTADTTVSPYKVKWATPASGSTYVGCSVSNSVGQNIADSTETAVTFDTEQWDTNAIHSTSVNTSRFTVPAGYAGKWSLTGGFPLTGVPAQWEFYIYVNGAYFITGYPQFSRAASSGRGTDIAVPAFEFNLAVADYVQVYAWHNYGSTTALRMQYGRAFFSYIGA